MASAFKGECIHRASAFMGRVRSWGDMDLPLDVHPLVDVNPLVDVHPLVDVNLLMDVSPFAKSMARH